MPNRTLQSPNCISAGTVYIDGSIESAGAGITAAGTTGGGFTPSYVGAGEYRITLSDTYVGFTRGLASIRWAAAAGGDKFANLGPFDSTNNRISVLVWDVSGNALTDAPATDRLDFQLCMDGSTVGYG